MDALQRDKYPNNGWTIRFATLRALREQAQEMNENPTEEEVEAVALAMVDLGYALIETINNHGPEGVSPKTWEELYESVNELMGHLGAFGEIDTQGPMCDRVMNALFDIDGGYPKNNNDS